jgi:ABC-type transport system substrate-binding protein
MTERPRMCGFATIAALLTVTFIAGACGGGNDQNSDGGAAALQSTDITVKPSTDTPKQGGTLSFGLEAAPDDLDPVAGKWAISAFMVANAVYDPLGALDAEGNPQPYLLESWSHNDDFTQWTLTSRPDVRFSDGTLADASFGVLQAKALQASPLTGPAVSYFDKVEAATPTTTVITMNRPWATFPFSLTGQGGFLPKYTEGRDENGKLVYQMDTTAPIGTGPFTYSGQSGNTYNLKKNPNYWLKDAAGVQLPYLDGVDFKVIDDSTSRLNALRSGDVNIIHSSTNELQTQMLDAAKAGGIQYWEDRGAREKGFVMFNTKSENPVIRDPKMRRALAYATDAAAYRTLQSIPEELALTTPYPQDSPWYVPTPDFPTYNVDEARKLVDEYKAANGGVAPQFNLASTPDPANTRALAILTDQWKQVGFDVRIDGREQVSLITSVATGAYDAVLWRQFGAADPDAEWYFWQSKNANGPGALSLNFAQYGDAETDKALDEARAIEDKARRTELYGSVFQRWAADVPYLWLNAVRWSIAADNSVQGVGNNALPDGSAATPFQTGVFRLTGTWLDT